MDSIEVEYPYGIIPRIEKQKKHLRFLKRNKYVDWIMIDIDVAERILKKGKNAETFFRKINPNIKVITTSTISDSQLIKYNVKKEIEVISQFSPKFHIPCDCPVYDEDKESTRLEIVHNYCSDLKYFKGEIDSLNIGIIPLIKAASKTERKMCYDTFRELGINYVSYYASQYFGGRKGGGRNILNKHLRQIISETDIENILVIGGQARSVLELFPPQIKSAAGLRWRKDMDTGLELNYGLFSYKKSQKLFGEWKTEIESKYLNCGLCVIERCGGVQ